MKLICYPTNANPTPEDPAGARRMTLKAAPRGRNWMDATPGSFANRCLPLTIANGYGWQAGADTAFRARWNGRVDKDAITIEALGEAAPTELPISHFGSGILTFHIHCLFRSEPGINLFVGGPINQPKDGIAPLVGIVEIDWSPFSFTMNWQFTRSGQWVTFRAGEPICQFFPVNPEMLEAVTPEYRALSSDPETEAQFRSWSESRNEFNENLNSSSVTAKADGWQKNYHRGQTINGDKTELVHRTKIKLKEFTDKAE